MNDVHEDVAGVLDDACIIVVHVAVGLMVPEQVISAHRHGPHGRGLTAQLSTSQLCTACSTIQSPDRRRWPNHPESGPHEFDQRMRPSTSRRSRRRGPRGSAR